MNILLIADTDTDHLLTVQCVIQRLHQKYRQCRIGLMTTPELHSLARRLEGVDELLTRPQPNDPVRLYWHAGHQLEQWQKQHGTFDQALVFGKHWKPALIPWIAGISRRTGSLGRGRFILLNDARWLSRKQFPSLYARYMALADDHGESSSEPFYPQLTANPDNARQLMQQHYLESERPAILFCPGGIDRSEQQWPVQHWAKLAAELIDQGWQIWLVAPAAAQSLCEQICHQLDRERQMEIANLAGKLAWEDKVDLIAASRILLTQDTLYSRLGRALNHPVVTLQGAEPEPFYPVAPEHVRQQGYPARQIRVRSQRSCQPCNEHPCRQRKPDQPHDPCLQELSVERVRAALLSMVPMQAVD